MTNRMCRRSAAIALGALALTAWGIAGCNDPLKAPPGAQADPLPPGNYPQIVVLDGLQPGLGLQPPTVEPSTPSRSMRITVPVRSLLDYPINIQYKFEYFDRLNRPLYATTDRWEFKHIEPRLQVVLDSAAMDLDAQAWRLTIRSAR